MSRRPAGRSLATRQRGNTALGLLIGVVVGLGIAAIVALLITKATIPFVSKQPRIASTAAVDPSGKLPDPNRALYSKDSLPSSLSPSLPSAPPVDSTVIAPAPPNVAPGADGKTPIVERSTPETGITMLQAGAFSSADDAETMRGRLALLGFDARLQPAERDGARIFRVRLGPYGRIDDLNRTRQRLIENGIDATLVPPGR